MSITNLPSPRVSDSSDSADGTKLFFDQYGREPLEFSANEVSAAVGFFQSNGFGDEAAQVTASVILTQAKLDGVPVFNLIDSLKSLNGLQLSSLIGEILNNNRNASSTLGFRTNSVSKSDQTRNIAA
jgi:hypothetical protein